MTDSIVTLQEVVHTVMVDGAATVAVVNEEHVTVVTVGTQGPAGPSGVQESYITAETLSGHVAITLDVDGLAIAADCRIAGHASSVLGVTLGASTLGDSVNVRAKGLIESSGWGLTPGLPVYLGESGALAQVVPVSALFIKPIGSALTSSSVLVDLQPAIFIT